MKIDTRSQLATYVEWPHGIIHLCVYMTALRWIFNANAFSFTRCLRGLYFIAVDTSESTNEKTKKITLPKPDEWIDEYWVIFQHSGFGLPKTKLVAEKMGKGAASTQASCIHQSDNVRMDIIEFLHNKHFVNKWNSLIISIECERLNFVHSQIKKLGKCDCHRTSLKLSHKINGKYTNFIVVRCWCGLRATSTAATAAALPIFIAFDGSSLQRPQRMSPSRLILNFVLR